MDEDRVACECCEVARSSARACEYARVCGEYLDAFRTYSPAGRHPPGFARDRSLIDQFKTKVEKRFPVRFILTQSLQNTHNL